MEIEPHRIPVAGLGQLAGQPSRLQGELIAPAQQQAQLLGQDGGLLDGQWRGTPFPQHDAIISYKCS